METIKYLVILNYESGVTTIMRCDQFLIENNIEEEDIATFMEENYSESTTNWMISTNLKIEL